MLLATRKLLFYRFWSIVLQEAHYVYNFFFEIKIHHIHLTHCYLEISYFMAFLTGKKMTEP